MKHFDVIIVGSGISSLTCAALLGKSGRSVCVLERYKKPGGYLHSFKRFGHQFETGAHYLGALDPGQPFHTLLSYLGIYDRELFIPLDAQGYDEFHFPDFQFTFPQGYEAVGAALCDRFPAEASGIRSYLSQIQTAVKAFQTYHYSLDFNLERLLPLLDRSLQSVVKEATTNPQLQAILYGHCYLHGVKPSDISFGLHALVVDSITRSVYGLRKGGDELARRFVAKIQSWGGEVRLQSTVNRILIADGKVSGVETAEGETLSADYVISGAHPKQTFRWIDSEAVPAIFQKRLQRVPESESIFGIYAEVDGEPPFSPLRNYYYFSSSDPDTMLISNEMDETPVVTYVTRPDRAGSSGPKYPLTIHAPGPYRWFESWRESSIRKRPEEYGARKNEVAERVLDTVEARCPGLRQRVLRYETSTALTNLHYNGSELGSGYGIYHSTEFTGMRSIGPRTRIGNLYLTGQSTLVPGLLGAATSGLRTAGEIVGLKGFLEDLMQMRAACE